MSNVIQCLMIDRLHIIGDIFDTLARFVMEVYENSSCKRYGARCTADGPDAQGDFGDPVQDRGADDQAPSRIQDGGAGFAGENFLYLR